MISVWLSEIQKNISILSDVDKPLRIVDKKRNKQLATIIWVKKKRSILSIWWIFSSQIPENKKNIDFKEVREKSKNLYFKDKYGKN